MNYKKIEKKIRKIKKIFGKKEIKIQIKYIFQGTVLLLLGFTFIATFLFWQLFAIDIVFTPRILATNFSEKTSFSAYDISRLKEEIIPENGIIIPVVWGNIGRRMVEIGIIDSEKFEALYSRRGGLSKYGLKLLYEENNDELYINTENSGEILNFLWAFGLVNKNPILEEGPMQDKKYGGADRFASTGGWSLAKGDTMDYYSKYRLVTLNSAQQELVERVSKNIYRPCCGNSVYFPDCNHGMAMLGLLELMASQGVSEEDIYKTALQVNSYWFPDTYLTIGKYFSKRGAKWNELNPKDILGSLYSSSSGYRQILAEVEPVQSRGGPSCGV